MIIKHSSRHGHMGLTGVDREYLKEIKIEITDQKRIEFYERNKQNIEKQFLKKKVSCQVVET